MNVFDEVRRCLDMDTVARFYGYSLNRGHYISCPFHAADHTPSLRIFESGFFCFACGMGGSVIDFVAQLFALDLIGAVRKLDADFHLDLPLDRPPSPQERRQAEAEARRRKRLAESKRALR